MCESDAMSAALIFSILLIWLMVCAICMAWFTAARRQADPRHCQVHDQPVAGALWVGLFVASLAAWVAIRIAMAH
jgi:hypothetical protein